MIALLRAARDGRLYRYVVPPHRNRSRRSTRFDGVYLQRGDKPDTFRDLQLREWQEINASLIVDAKGNRRHVNSWECLELTNGKFSLTDEGLTILGFNEHIVNESLIVDLCEDQFDMRVRVDHMGDGCYRIEGWLADLLSLSQNTECQLLALTKSPDTNLIDYGLFEVQRIAFKYAYSESPRATIIWPRFNIETGQIIPILNKEAVLELKHGGVDIYRPGRGVVNHIIGLASAASRKRLEYWMPRGSLRRSYTPPPYMKEGSDV